MRVKVIAVTLTLFGLASPGLRAQQQVDMDTIMRWSTAKVVSYRIVGVYTGPTTIAYDQASGQADVTDRVVIELRWDIQENRMVGQPKVENAASEVTNFRNGQAGCAAPVVHGAYEHFEVTQVAPGDGDMVELTGMTSFPEVEITDCSGQEERRTVAAKQATSVVHLPIAAPMLLGMPEMPPTGDMTLTVSPDKKSFGLKLKGWSWTYTPTRVS